jgi:hypothetical protein
MEISYELVSMHLGYQVALENLEEKLKTAITLAYIPDELTEDIKERLASLKLNLTYYERTAEAFDKAYDEPRLIESAKGLVKRFEKYSEIAGDIGIIYPKMPDEAANDN